MYLNVTPDSSFNLCPQTIHISPKDPGCVHTILLEEASKLISRDLSEVEPTKSCILSNSSNFVLFILLLSTSFSLSAPAAASLCSSSGPRGEESEDLESSSVSR
uniref:Uncharacterized protein MANES_08G068000 n=1 Tax=Rhizophora mucronata TaxID=61149 RepID=A0A2P2KLF4_RHIMU